MVRVCRVAQVDSPSEQLARVEYQQVTWRQEFRYTANALVFVKQERPTALVENGEGDDGAGPASGRIRGREPIDEDPRPLLARIKYGNIDRHRLARLSHGLANPNSKGSLRIRAKAREEEQSNEKHAAGSCPVWLRPLSHISRGLTISSSAARRKERQRLTPQKSPLTR